MSIDDRSSQTKWATLEIEIEPTPGVDIQLEPRVAVGGRGLYTLVVRNESDRSLTLDLVGVEHAGECTVRTAPGYLEVAPGSQARSEIEVRGPRPWVGTHTPRPIAITASDRSGERWVADGELRHSPRLPRWLLVTLVVALVAAVWLTIMIVAIRIVRDDPVDPFDLPPAEAAGPTHAPPPGT